MALQLDEYRAKLINTLLFASSQEEVKRFIDAAIKAMEQNKLSHHIISLFIVQMISDLEAFNPMKKEAQQWSNIKTAKVLLARTRSRFDTSVN